MRRKWILIALFFVSTGFVGLCFAVDGSLRKQVSQRVLQLARRIDVASELRMTNSQREELNHRFGMVVNDPLNLFGKNSQKIEPLPSPVEVLTDGQVLRLWQLGFHCEISRIGFERAISEGEFGREIGLNDQEMRLLKDKVKNLEEDAAALVVQILKDLQQDVLAAIPEEKRGNAEMALGRPFYPEDVIRRFKLNGDESKP